MNSACLNDKLDAGHGDFRRIDVVRPSAPAYGLDFDGSEIAIAHEAILLRPGNASGSPMRACLTPTGVNHDHFTGSSATAILAGSPERAAASFAAFSACAAASTSSGSTTTKSSQPAAQRAPIRL
jgi:hypothetical protein